MASSALCPEPEPEPCGERKMKCVWWQSRGFAPVEPGCVIDPTLYLRLTFGLGLFVVADSCGRDPKLPPVLPKLAMLRYSECSFKTCSFPLTKSISITPMSGASHRWRYLQSVCPTRALMDDCNPFVMIQPRIVFIA